MADTQTQNRTPQSQDTRAQFERPKAWMPPQTLPDPLPEEGFVFRWIRLSANGQDDPSNISAKFREGWEPVKASMHPEIQLLSQTGNRFPDGIEIGGLLLCKIPKEFIEQRDAYFRKQTEGQMQSVDNNFMRENDPRAPLFKERRSTVSFGKGS